MEPEADQEADHAMKITDEIQTIVAIESARTCQEPLRWRIYHAIAQLANAEAHELSAIRWFEYEIDTSDRATADREAELLAWLRSLDIAAAPEVAAAIPFGANECVMVRRYWACPGERLVIPDDIAGAPWPEAARTRFRQDMAKLADHGKIHPYARGFAHMYLSDRSGTIVLNTWPVLCSGNERERQDFLASIDFQLQQRT